ncbi:MAG TPA: SLC13 family permease, partial [Chloroflexota bacterium]|nr:SLC13 family permease [Chloroflexota bacterium]
MATHSMTPGKEAWSRSLSRHMAGTWLKLALTVLATLAVLLLPPQPGLSPEGQRVLSIVAAAVVLWATEVIPVAVSSLLVVVLLMVMGTVKSPSQALVGFSSPIVFFLVGSLAMGAAIMKSGLAERLAGYLLRRSGGDPKWLAAQLLLSMPFIAFVMPSAINRNSMLIPAYERVFQTLSVGKRDPLSKVIMLTLGLLNPFASSAFMTGGLAPMTTSTLLGGFTWFRWFGLMAVPYYTLLALGGLMVYLIYRPPTSTGPSPEVASTPHKPLTRDEKVTLA